MGLTKRNYGIDLLRIFAMLFVIILHMCSYGGVSDGLGQFSQQQYAVDLLQAVAYCAVNCYALISGFVGIKSEPRYTNIVLLWLQGLTYSVAFAVLSIVIGINSFSLSFAIKSLFPVMTNRWWYLTKYAALFFLMPVLNLAIRNIPKKKMRLMLIVLGALYMISEVVFRESVFDTAGGYSVTWLAFLYMLGAYIAVYDVPAKIHKWQALTAFLVCTACTFLWKVIVERLTFLYTGSPKFGMWLYRYTSPTVLIAAIALVLLFAKVKISRPALISLFSPLTFGVFLIHTNSYFLQAFCEVLVGNVADSLCLLVIIKVVIAAICVFFICAIIDYLRLWVIKKLGLREKLLGLENRFISANH